MKSSMLHDMLVTVTITALSLIYSVLQAVSGQSMPNFSPMLALVFVCAATLKGVWRWILPALAWAISYPINAALQGYSWHEGLLPTLVAAVLVGLYGIRSKSQSPKKLWLHSCLAVILFYLVTNAFSWVGDLRYAKNLHGFIQCFWTGIPGIDPLPTWVFLKNSLISNGLFSGLLIFGSYFENRLALRHLHLQNAENY